MDQNEFTRLLGSTTLKEIRDQLDKYETVLNLANSNILNERSKRAIVIQAAKEFDIVTTLISDYYSRLGDVALPTKEVKKKDDIFIEKPSAKRKDSSSSDESQTEHNDILQSIVKPKVDRGRPNKKTTF